GRMSASRGARNARREIESAKPPQARPPGQGRQEVSDDEGPEWFAPKRYGIGIGKPISWQGWAITIGFVGLAIPLSVKLAHPPLKLVAALAPLTVLLMVISAKTTRGGWRWRWGDPD